MKFGGTSVGNAVRFRQCESIIRSAAPQDQIIVVVSAVAGVTDLIVNTIDAAQRGDVEVMEKYLETFDAIHRKLLHDLFRHDRLMRLLVVVSGYAGQLRDCCRALCSLGLASSPETSDLLLALGEKISASVLAGYLCEMGVEAQFVPGENIITTDEAFGNAVPDMEATRRNCTGNVLPLLNRSVIPVIAGYTGATANGQTTTLGRGGSDYSASIIAAATSSDEVWIWTDVDGVLTADPHLCPDATTLSEINFAQAIDLAYYGAKVIHRKAIYPALQSGIPMWVKNSFRPNTHGTRISRNGRSIDMPLDAVTCLNHAVLMTLVARHETQSSELFGRLILRLGQEQIDVLLAAQSFPQGKLELIVRGEDRARALELIRSTLRSELAHGILSPVAVQKEVAVVAVLGGDGQTSRHSTAIALAALSQRGLDILAFAGGSNGRSVCLALPTTSAAEAVRLIHQELNRKHTMRIPLFCQADTEALTES
ncbi:MAG TPA: aspartate kinase [Candidatus Angelobacter sp.]|nr:aspartate kinase [Candidatus Angelobacter sp.]